MQEIIDKAKDYDDYSRIMANAHFSLAEDGRVKHRNMGIFVTCFSTIVGTTIFATISKTHVKSDDVDWIGIITGFLSIAAAVLSALQTFLKFSEDAALHKKAALAYETIFHKIDFFLLSYSNVSEDDLPMKTKAIDDLTILAVSLEKISEFAPTVPDGVYNKFAAFSNRNPGGVKPTSVAAPSSVLT